MLQQCQQLGDFEIIRLLGRGGMGEVYEARQKNPDRLVALKVLNARLAGDEDALKRFWREAEVPANLDHHGIVRIIATGKTPEGIAYYAMHLVRGLSLSDLIAQVNAMPTTAGHFSVANDTPTMDALAAGSAGPRPEGAASQATGTLILKQYRDDRFGTLARIGAQAARALSYAHQQGFLHRDIKPSNLMVDQHLHVHLVDFGLTRALDPEAGGGLTEDGIIPGTAWYMSPEQAEGKELDPRSDIYSLGVTLYELATQGLGPFTADRRNRSAVLAQVRAGGILPLRTLAPGIPRELERIILRAMDFRPARRYADAADLAHDLDAFTQAASSRQEGPSAARPRPRPWLDRWVLAGAAAGLLAASLCLCWWLLTRQTNETPLAEEKKLEKEGADTNAGQTKNDTPADKKKDRPFFERERPPGTRINLLRDDFHPVLHRFLAPGSFQLWPSELVLTAPGDGGRSLAALDDPGERNFEFSVEVKAWEQKMENRNDLGIFFGWGGPGTADPLRRRRFFVLQLDGRPVLGDKHGRMQFGTWAQEGVNEQNVRVFPGRGVVALAAPAAGAPWRRLWVRVQNDMMTAGVDNQPPLQLDVAWIRANDKALKTYLLDPHGSLGVWTKNGRGSFRNATLLVLPGSP